MYRIYREKDGEIVMIARCKEITDAIYTLEEACEDWSKEWSLHMERETDENHD
jgi:hypothetical protein